MLWQYRIPGALVLRAKGSRGKDSQEHSRWGSRRNSIKWKVGRSIELPNKTRVLSLLKALLTGWKRLCKDPRVVHKDSRVKVIPIPLRNQQMKGSRWVLWRSAILTVVVSRRGSDQTRIESSKSFESFLMRERWNTLDRMSISFYPQNRRRLCNLRALILLKAQFPTTEGSSWDVG